MIESISELKKNTIIWFKKINPCYMFVTRNKIKEIDYKLNSYYC
jgi:hypothetical protein